MQGLISGCGNIAAGGQGGDVSTLLRVRCYMGGVSPTSTTTINGKTYNTFPVSTSYVKFYTVTQLNDEEELTISEISNYIFYPISNNNSDVGCILYINNGALSGNILSTESELSTVEFIFTYVIDLSQPAVTVTELQNYTDMVFGGSSGGSNTLQLINLDFDSKIVEAEKRLVSSMMPTRDDANQTKYGYDAKNNLISCKYADRTLTTYYGEILYLLNGTAEYPGNLLIENLAGSIDSVELTLKMASSGTSGSNGYTVNWYTDDTLLHTDSGTLASSSSTSETMVIINSPGDANKLKVSWGNSTGSGRRYYGIRPYTKVWCNSTNLPMNGVGYYNLPDPTNFVPPSGAYSALSINDIEYNNKDTNYKSGKYVAYYDGENINYMTTTTTNV